MSDVGPSALDLLSPIGSADERGPLAALFGADFSSLSLTPTEGWRAPAVVREALARFSAYDAERKMNLAAWKVLDLGDAGAASLDWAGAWHAIASRALQAAAAAPIVVTLGGDHSVTWPVVTALAPKGSRVGIVQLDVHHDTRPLDAGPSNGTPIRGLIEQGVVQGRNVVQVGIHPFANRKGIGDWAEEQGVQRISLATLRREGAEAAARRVTQMLAACDWLYLTVDIDVLDRSHAPGTAAALPGGLLPHELTDLVNLICSDGRIAAMDVVEFDPGRDVQSITAYNACNVLLVAFSAFARRHAQGVT